MSLIEVITNKCEDYQPQLYYKVSDTLRKMELQQSSHLFFGRANIAHLYIIDIGILLSYFAVSDFYNCKTRLNTYCYV